MGALLGIILAHAAVGFFGWQSMLDAIDTSTQTTLIIIKSL